jgi:ElaB/YqjD/DUF883 family membrane-anchored ribosome-binding protein
MTDPSTASAPENITDKAYRLKDQVGNTASLAKDVAAQGITAIRDKASALCQATTGKVVGLKDSAVDLVRDNPLATVLVSVGVGALVGLLLARRR